MIADTNRHCDHGNIVIELHSRHMHTARFYMDPSRSEQPDVSMDSRAGVPPTVLVHPGFDSDLVGLTEPEQRIDWHHKV